MPGSTGCLTETPPQAHTSLTHPCPGLSQNSHSQPGAAGLPAAMPATPSPGRFGNTSSSTDNSRTCAPFPAQHCWLNTTASQIQPTSWGAKVLRVNHTGDLCHCLTCKGPNITLTPEFSSLRCACSPPCHGALGHIPYRTVLPGLDAREKEE